MSDNQCERCKGHLIEIDHYGERLCPLVVAYQGSSYSQRQAFKDNLKMAQVYKKWAKAVA